MKNLTLLLWEFLSMLIDIIIVHTNDFSDNEKQKRIFKYISLFYPLVNMIFIIISTYISEK